MSSIQAEPPPLPVLPTCANCGRAVGRLETLYRIRDNDVCPDCHPSLARPRPAGRAKPVPVFVWWAVAVAIGGVGCVLAAMAVHWGLSEPTPVYTAARVLPPTDGPTDGPTVGSRARETGKNPAETVAPRARPTATAVSPRPTTRPAPSVTFFGIADGGPATTDGPTTAPAEPAAVVDRTGRAAEAADVLADAAASYPDAVPAGGAELIHVYDADAFRRDGGRLADVGGAYARHPFVGNSPNARPLLWGVYEPLDAGRYVVVYRVRLVKDAHTGRPGVAFLDVAVGGNTAASLRPPADAFPADGWADVPVPLTLKTRRRIEPRLWANRDVIAVDRVYVYHVGN